MSDQRGCIPGGGVPRKLDVPAAGAGTAAGMAALRAMAARARKEMIFWACIFFSRDDRCDLLGEGGW